MSKMLSFVFILIIASPSHAMQNRSTVELQSNPFAVFDDNVLEKITSNLDIKSWSSLRRTRRFFYGRAWPSDKKIQVSLGWPNNESEDSYWQRVLARIGQIEAMLVRFNAHNVIELYLQSFVEQPKLTYLPDGLANTRYVRLLNLNSNTVTLLQLERLPSLLPLLQYLNLCNQKLDALPLALRQLTSLQSLIVSRNALGSQYLCHIPSSVTKLVLGSNTISGFHDLHKQLPSLRVLSLMYCDLAEEDFEQLALLAPQLEDLSISVNNQYEFKKLSECLAKFEKLRDLYILFMELNLTALQVLTQLKSLRRLNLHGNELTELEKVQVSAMFPDSVEIIF